MLQGNGVPIARTQVWEKGGAGGTLAQQVVTAIDEQPGNYRRLYQNEESLPDKAAKIVKEIYGGSNVVFSSVAQRQLNVFKKMAGINCRFVWQKHSTLLVMIRSF